MRLRLGRNVIALGVVSFFTDLSSEMIYPLLPLFLSGVLGASASAIGAIEGAAESTAALLKLASGWWSDRVRRRKPLVLLGYTIATVARPLVAIAQAASQVLAIRLVDRVGKGIRTAPRDALIADSVEPSGRGRAFGFHRAADHAGAVVGPLVAFAALRWGDLTLRNVFWLAAVPGAIALLVLVLAVRETARGAPPDEHDTPLVPALPHQASAPPIEPPPRDPRFRRYLAVLLLFTLGNSTDAFLLLRATDLGVPVALTPVLWAFLHVVKSLSSTPGGALSDRLGRRPVIIAGWLVYAVTYLGFAVATDGWHAWALFAIYGLYFGMVEGTEKALVADLVPVARRGAAFGWYNLVIGVGALPASIFFGLLWDAHGAGVAFTAGAALALVAGLGLLLSVRGAPRDQQQREPGRA